MKKIIVICCLLPVLRLSVMGQDSNCFLYKQGFELLNQKYLKNRTVYIMNGFTGIKLKYMKEDFFERINYDTKDDIDKSLFNYFYLSADTILNCIFESKNVTISDWNTYSKLYQSKLCQSDSIIWMPANITFSKILYIDDRYAYFDMYVQPGRFSFWVILEKEDKSWGIIKSGYVQ